MSATLVTTIKSPRRKESRRWYKLLRHGVMASFFLFLLFVAYEHRLVGGGPRGAASVEAYCPFGGLETSYLFLTNGGFVRRVEPSSLILFATVLALTLAASRGFCSWICPFGSLQEWIGMLGKRLLKRRFNPTGAWDRRLRYLKYAVLAVTLAFTWRLSTLVFRDYDPFLAFFRLGDDVQERPWAYAALAVVVAGSLWIDRFFCKYLCPLGAVLALAGKAGLTRIHRDAEGCNSCGLCRRECRAHVDLLAATKVRDAECDQCMDCVAACPKPGVLTQRGPGWRLSHPLYAAVLVAGLFAMIGAGQLAGKWQTKVTTISFKDAQGKLDTEKIRGWMNLEEVSAGFGIPLPVLYCATGIPTRVPSTARLNTIAAAYHVEFSPEKLREVVRSYMNGKPDCPLMSR